jgi:hypothetical protein
MADKVSDACPDGCTFTNKVAGPRSVVPHAPAEHFRGWKVMAGVCRSAGDPGSLEAKPNGKYSNKAGADGGPPTQAECKDLCAAEDNCIGYAHSTAWCLLYGPGLHETADGDVWAADNHDATTITQTKPNPAYICGVKEEETTVTPEESTTVTPVTQDDDDSDDDPSDSGVMVVFSLLLTSLLQ